MPTWHDMVLRKEKGSGALWRRLFADQQIYTLILDLLAGRHEYTNVTSTSDAEEKKKKGRQLTLAQGRILRILPRLAALDLNKVARSEVAAPTPGYYLSATARTTTNGHNIPRPIPNARTTNYNSDILTNGVGVEQEEEEEEATQMPLPAPPKQGQGLLHFAALRMVDRNDVLMHLSLIDFFEAFVGLMRVTPHSEDKVNVVKEIVREAVADDELLRESLEGLPDRTVDEERDELREWVREVVPPREEMDVVMR